MYREESALFRQSPADPAQRTRPARDQGHIRAAAPSRRGHAGAGARGLVLVQAGNEVWTVMPGSLGWIPPGVMHGARWFGDAHGSFLFVRPDACAQLPSVCRSWPSSRLIEAVVERIASGPPGMLSEAYLAQLFEVLLEEVRLREHDPMPLPMPEDPRLQDLANTLLSTPDDPSGIDDWAQRLNMSSRTLMRRFRQETGVTLGQWQRAPAARAGDAGPWRIRHRGCAGRGLREHQCLHRQLSGGVRRHAVALRGWPRLARRPSAFGGVAGVRIYRSLPFFDRIADLLKCPLSTMASG